MKRVFPLKTTVTILAIATWWIWTAPPSAVQIAGPVTLGVAPAGFDAMTRPTDWIASKLKVSAPDLPGHDDIVLLDGNRQALATGMDGWIWRIDLEEQRAERFADVPLIAAGARLAPDNPKRLYFCTSRLSGTDHPKTEAVGLYALDLETLRVEQLVSRVPETSDRGAQAPELRASKDFRWSLHADLNAANSRALAFCNDLDVSADGERIYFTEPFAYEGASMGGGARFEAVSLGRNARIWTYETNTGRIAQVASGMQFADGILIEADADGADRSLLVSETVAFRIVRLFLDGPQAGKTEIILENLPGMPDGLDRDEDGNVWVGLLKLRSSTIDWLHANPWIKPLILRLPTSLMPVSMATAVMAFDPRTAAPLFFASDDGQAINDVAVAVPGSDFVYLPTFDREGSGLHRIPRPPLAP